MRYRWTGDPKGNWDRVEVLEGPISHLHGRPCPPLYRVVFWHAVMPLGNPGWAWQYELVDGDPTFPKDKTFVDVSTTPTREQDR